jgi:tRNA-specific 2-thiouridylase
MKVMVAMSGGVDSSVAAVLLKEQGHEIVGATMLLRPISGDEVAADTAAADATKVAEKFGFPHYFFDFREIFTSTIIDDFCREYSIGHTPNPCVLCNRQIKFGVLWEKAREMGADFLATGHYARIEQNSNRWLLKKGTDHKKDQSYFLYRLTQEQLSHTIFPLADLTKEKVKQMAQEMNLPAVSRPESQEICFIPDNDYAGFLKKRLFPMVMRGPIIDGTGKKLGDHQGIMNYTIGQRKGLGITSAEPWYVTRIDATNNTITVGTKEDTYNDELVAEGLNWITISTPDIPLDVKAKIRYRHQEADAVVTPFGENEAHVKFAVPQMAITPGQSVVFYDGDTVLGGGIIIKQGR